MSSDEYSDRLARFKALEGDLANANKEIAGLRSDLEGSEGFAADKRKEVKQLQAENSELRERSRSPEELTEQYKTAQRHIQELETDLPLVKVAVAIRCRYLEQAHAVNPQMTQGKFNQKIIEAGNRAAHSAMGHVDELLFRRDHLDTGMKMRLGKTFTDLYKTTADKYGSMSEKLLKAIDCDATIRTLTVLNKGLRPLKQRQLAADQMNILQRKHGKMAREARTGEQSHLQDFEKDEEIDRRLARVIELTEEIVVADRQSGRY